ncbi:MAG: hypothetical protein WCD77_19685 [Acidobacteriaceae bacterium]
MTTRANNDDRIALLQGTLDLLILKSLVFGSRHGQGVAATDAGDEPGSGCQPRPAK